MVRSQDSTRSLAANIDRLHATVSQLDTKPGTDTTDAIEGLAQDLERRTISELPSAASEALTRINAIGAALQREHFMPSDR
jgi:hypothetical protein